MTAKQSRPGGRAQAAEAFDGATAILQHGITRCCHCHRPISDAKSVANGYGRVCAARQAAAQLDERRESVSTRLDALSARVGLLDADALAIVAAGLADILDALNAEGAIA